MTTTRTIKRYSNRKLYDMAESRYVTLDEVALFVQNGDEVQIIDNKTKEDITSVTLAQIVYEQEKKKNFLPLNTLKGIIRSSGELLQRTIASPMANIREDAERTVSSMRIEAERGVKHFKEELERALQYLAERGDARPLVKELSDNTQRAYDEFSRTLDDRIKQLMRGMRQQQAGDNWRKKVDKKMADLEARLKKIEGR